MQNVDFIGFLWFLPSPQLILRILNQVGYIRKQGLTLAWPFPDGICWLAQCDLTHWANKLFKRHEFCNSSVCLCVLWEQDEPVEVKQESERSHSQDISIPASIVYNDADTFAHPSVSQHSSKLSIQLFSLHVYHTLLLYRSHFLSSTDITLWFL